MPAKGHRRGLDRSACARICAFNRGDPMFKAVSWLENFRRTKTFDLLAASPLILWYLAGVSPAGADHLDTPRTGERHHQSSISCSSLRLRIVRLIFVLVYLLITRRTPELRSYGAYLVWWRFAARFWEMGSFISGPRSSRFRGKRLPLSSSSPARSGLLSRPVAWGAHSR